MELDARVVERAAIEDECEQESAGSAGARDPDPLRGRIGERVWIEPRTRLRCDLDQGDAARCGEIGRPEDRAAQWHARGADDRVDLLPRSAAGDSRCGRIGGQGLLGRCRCFAARRRRERGGEGEAAAERPGGGLAGCPGDPQGRDLAHRRGRTRQTGILVPSASPVVSSSKRVTPEPRPTHSPPPASRTAAPERRRYQLPVRRCTSPSVTRGRSSPPSPASSALRGTTHRGNGARSSRSRARRRRVAGAAARRGRSRVERTVAAPIDDRAVLPAHGLEVLADLHAVSSSPSCAGARARRASSEPTTEIEHALHVDLEAVEVGEDEGTEPIDIVVRVDARPSSS